ncbi:MAG TPA: hypothetical protein DIC64_01480 [Alphaproteobacteria bacterium]|nr:hypothetical protein [Alphaproteobacteria bacterium]
MVAQIDRIKNKLLIRLLLGLILSAVFAFGASAAPSLLTDDEMETLIKEIVKPIFKVANVSFDENRIHLLNDMSLNAFVSDGNHLFVHTGTILKAENVNEISGILAHETGHIAGGHIMRQKLKIQDLQTLSVISLIAAGGAAVASGRGDAAMAIALGSHGSLLNSLMAYQMTEERSADESAVKYLKALKQSPAGLKNFMKTIQKANRLSGYEETPYFKTHPMSSERLAFFEKAEKENGGKTASMLDKDFEFVKAKLFAFLMPVERTLKKYPLSDKTDVAMYAHAVVKFKQKKFAEAVLLMNNLIEKYPSNPYFYQLKGQFLFESGKADEALKAYQKALELKPNSNETMLLYAESAMETNLSKTELQNVIDTLNKLQIRQETPRGWELLAKAYYQKGVEAQSLYAMAKYSFLIGNVETGKKQIKKALSLNPSDSLKLKLKDLEEELKEEEKL